MEQQKSQSHSKWICSCGFSVAYKAADVFYTYPKGNDCPKCGKEMTIKNEKSLLQSITDKDNKAIKEFDNKVDKGEQIRIL